MAVRLLLVCLDRRAVLVIGVAQIGNSIDIVASVYLLETCLETKQGIQNNVLFSHVTVSSQGYSECICFNSVR